MREKSLDFLGYPNYSVTDDGKVFSLNYKRSGKKKELKPGLCDGYYRRWLCRGVDIKQFRFH